MPVKSMSIGKPVSLDSSCAFSNFVSHLALRSAVAVTCGESVLGGGRLLMNARSASESLTCGKVLNLPLRSLSVTFSLSALTKSASIVAPVELVQIRYSACND